MAVLAALGAVLVLNVLIPIHKPIKQWVQGLHISSIILRQLPAVAWAQQFTHPVLDAAVFASAATVTLHFYLTVLPIMAWCGYEHLVARLVAMLGLQGYVVFGLKDLLESPRPGDCMKAAPSHIRINVRDYSGDIEDGIPSAHCSGSVQLLFYAINMSVAAGLISGNWKLPLQLAASAWVAWIAFGRLYLGLHSPVDLATGSLVGLALLSLWEVVEQPYVQWLGSDPQLPLHVLLVGFLLMRFYPMPWRYTSCYQYAIAWCGGWCGVTLGYRYMHPVMSNGSSADGITQAAGVFSSEHADQLFSGWMGWVCILAKVAIGLVAVAATKVITKETLLLLLQRLFSLVPTSIRCLWQPPVVCHGNSKVSGDDAASQQQQQQQQPGKEIVPCNHSNSIWTLRYAANGMALDVVTAAKFGSYVAVGFVIFTMDAWWQQLMARIVYMSSTA